MLSQVSAGDDFFLERLVRYGKCAIWRKVIKGRTASRRGAAQSDGTQLVAQIMSASTRQLWTVLAWQFSHHPRS
jgi:hypothetical protein